MVNVIDEVIQKKKKCKICNKILKIDKLYFVLLVNETELIKK